MPEAITKYAINSSLGRKDFVPLDVLIKGYRHLIPSDEILFSPAIKQRTFFARDIGKRIQVSNIEFKISGNVNLKIITTTNGGESGYNPKQKTEIEKNGQIIYSSGEVKANFESQKIIDVDINDIISVYLTPLGNISDKFPISIQSLYVAAQISDIPIFDK